MDVRQALDILRKHQEWRRYDGDLEKGPAMQKPELIGKALDIAIKIMEDKVNGKVQQEPKGNEPREDSEDAVP